MLNYSEKEIRFRLEQKGYREEAVDTAYELVLADFDNPELSAVCSFLRKKLPSGTDPNEDEFTENVQKAMAAAYRKGFGYEIIRQGMKELYRM